MERFSEAVKRPGGGGGSGGPERQEEDVCSRPLSGAANRGETVNSRRAQVRRELSEAIRRESRTSRDTNAYLSAIGRNVARLTPNIGTWIKGGTSRPDGNYLFGAITAELGISPSIALGFADFAEYADDLLDRLFGSDADEAIGNVDQESQDQIREGARCPG